MTNYKLKRKKTLHALRNDAEFKVESMYLDLMSLKDAKVITLKANGKKIANAAVKKVGATAVAISLVSPAGVAMAAEQTEEVLENNDAIEMVVEETPEVEATEEVKEETPVVEETEEVKEETPEVEETEEVKEETPEVEETEEVKEETPEVEATEEVKEEAPEVEETEEVKEETSAVETTEEVKEETPEVEATEEVKEETPEVAESNEVEATIPATQAEEAKETKKEETPDYMGVESIRPGVNVSDKKEETKYVMPSDTTYVVIKTPDGKKVVWNTQSLGNPNQQLFIDKYNGIANDKLDKDTIFADGYGNVIVRTPVLDENGKPVMLYPMKDENGNFIFNENGELVYGEGEPVIGFDGIVKYDETIIGKMELDPATGEKIFTGIEGTEVNFGVNTPKEVKDPDENLQTVKPVKKPTPDEPTPGKPDEPTPDEPNEPEVPTPEKPTPEVPRTVITSTPKTGDSTRMIINGAAAVVLASGLVLAASTYANMRENKKLVLR